MPILVQIFFSPFNEKTEIYQKMPVSASDEMPSICRPVEKEELRKYLLFGARRSALPGANVFPLYFSLV